MALIGLTGHLAIGAATSPQSFVKVGGVNVLVNGSTVANHAPGGIHNGATFIKPASFFRINGQAVIVAGDLATCAHPLVVPSGFVDVG